MAEQKGFNIHEELVKRCRRGDRKAQSEIYRLYYKAMFNTSLRMLNNRTEAEDVMQEAFLSAFLKIDQYRGDLSFGAWLKRIVINKTIDVLRSRKLHFEEINEKMEDDAKRFPESNEPDEEEILRMVNRIRDAILQLPDGFRVVLSLALFEGYDHEEIAGILGISESTSRSQLARAKRKLVEFIKISDHE